MAEKAFDEDAPPEAKPWRELRKLEKNCPECSALIVEGKICFEAAAVEDGAKLADRKFAVISRCRGSFVGASFEGSAGKRQQEAKDDDGAADRRTKAQLEFGLPVAPWNWKQAAAFKASFPEELMRCLLSGQPVHRKL